MNYTEKIFDIDRIKPNEISREVRFLCKVFAFSILQMSFTVSAEIPRQQTSTLEGLPLFSAPPSEGALAKLKSARKAHIASPDDPGLLIWWGRRMAYTGNFLGAIDIFTQGIEKYPNDPRFYRHRGHRYISVREFKKASDTLEVAAKLISGTRNEIEPDGLPNAMGIPISSLHGNTWYHLGLAYYLQHDWSNALRAYTHGFNAARNPDNQVSTTHWRYMILRRMGRHAEANAVLENISSEMAVIENTNYYNLCLFYKGNITLEELTKNLGDNPGGAAIAYGVANWHYVEGDTAEAKKQLEALTTNNSWASFGYIAAESDLFHWPSL